MKFEIKFHLTAINEISTLLDCPGNVLAIALCQRINYIRGEKFVVPLNQREAADNRDALAKVIYNTLFSWLVNKINKCIVSDVKVPKSKAFIGVLDIFG